MKFKIVLSNGSVKELIETLQEFDQWKIGYAKTSKLTVTEGDFKKKYLVEFLKATSKKHKPGKLPYTETTLTFTEIEDKEEEIERNEMNYHYFKEKLTETNKLRQLPLTHPKLRYRKRYEQDKN